MTLEEVINYELRQIKFHIENLERQDVESNRKYTKSYQNEITYWLGACRELYDLRDLVKQGDIKGIRKEVAQ